MTEYKRAVKKAAIEYLRRAVQKVIMSSYSPHNQTFQDIFIAGAAWQRDYDKLDAELEALKHIMEVVKETLPEYSPPKLRQALQAYESLKEDK